MSGRSRLLAELRAFRPCNEQEAGDRDLILHLVETQERVFFRDNKHAHMTASAWVVNKDRSRVLMVYHNLYHSWSWLGGHADGNEDLLSVAINEVREESGLNTLIPVSDQIYSLEILTVDGHEKHGAYVSSHLHLNVTYLLEGDENELLRIKPDENSAVRWFAPEEAIAFSTEPWFQERIYRKLIDRSAGDSIRRNNE